MDIDLCPECKTPELFNLGQIWLNNGDIVQRENPEARIAFIECENLDPLFKNIEDIIDLSIEDIIINVTARGIRRYMDRLLTKEIKQLIRTRQLDVLPMVSSITSYCHIVGYGRYEFLDYRYEGKKDDFTRFRVYRPFSIPEVAGSLAGAVSSAVGGEHAVTYKEVSPRLYEFKTHWTEYPNMYKEKLPLISYRQRDGDIEFERCPTCGCPSAFSEYLWHLENGLIINTRTGRRMALLGPELMDQVFNVLESELGGTIPETIVEAQRRFAKTGFYTIKEISNEEEFRTELALRGLGNLREIHMNANGMSVRINNVTAHLMTIGMIQGLYEMAMDVSSDVEWEISEERDLVIEVKPKKI